MYIFNKIATFKVHAEALPHLNVMPFTHLVPRPIYLNYFTSKCIIHSRSHISINEHINTDRQSNKLIRNWPMQFYNNIAGRNIPFLEPYRMH